MWSPANTLSAVCGGGGGLDGHMPSIRIKRAKLPIPKRCVAIHVARTRDVCARNVCHLICTNGRHTVEWRGGQGACQVSPFSLFLLSLFACNI